PVSPSCSHARPSSSVESQRVFEMISPRAIKFNFGLCCFVSFPWRASGVLSRASLAILLFAAASAANAQETENRPVVVEAEAGELPSAYGAPPDLSHGRISTLTKSYVLSPFSFELEAGYEGAVFRHGLPSQLFRQEIEMGLPARFTVGIQNQLEHFAGDTHDRSFTLEARYAFANWNK